MSILYTLSAGPASDTWPRRDCLGKCDGQAELLFLINGWNIALPKLTGILTYNTYYVRRLASCTGVLTPDTKTNHKIDNRDIHILSTNHLEVVQGTFYFNDDNVQYIYSIFSFYVSSSRSGFIN